MSLNLSERRQLAEAWISAGHSRDMKVIIHVGCDSIMDACDLATHAQSAGADAISAMPPVFFKSSGATGVAQVRCAPGVAARALV